MRRSYPQLGALTPHVNGALDAAVKEKLDNYQHDYNDYNARNYFFLPAVMMTSGRISGDFREGE